MAPAQDRFIYHEAQQQVASVCVTGTGSPGQSSGCTQSAMGGSGRIHLATSSHIGQSGGEVAGLPVQENISGAAQHALVLGSSGHVHPNPTEPTQPVDTALQSDPSQKSDKSQRVSRVSAIKEQDISETVAARIEGPQRGSTRSGYEARWPFLQSRASLIRCTSGYL